MYFFREIGVENSVIEDTKSSNTAREVLDRLLACESHEVINQVCARAKKNYGAITDARVKIHLVHSSGTIICSV